MKKLILPVVGVIAASFSVWLCDDIFITFRYIQQWFNGNGLVYNPGEYVEGYTHTLWLMMLAGCHYLGMSLEMASQMLGLLSFGGVVFLLGTGGWLAAVLFILNTDARIWATGGLETMLFTLLVFLSVWCVLRRKNWIGWVLLAMVLTRPDGIVVALVVLAFLKKDALRLGWPLLLLIPVLIAKYIYYGDFLPNTYYAKEGGGSNYTQGWVYIWAYVSVYISSFFIFLSWKTVRRKEILLPITIIVAYIVFFVARVGGDFMYARFIIPIVPLIYFVIESSLAVYGKNLLYAVLLLVPVEMYLRDNMFYTGKEHRPAFELNGITDEYWYYTRDVGGMNSIRRDSIIGVALRDGLGDGKFSVLLRGQAAFGYYSQFYNCVENSGLTDKYIAHLPSEKRGRPGHEKSAPLQYLKDRGVHFVFNRPPYDTTNPQIQFNLGVGVVRAEVITYDSLVKARFR